MGLEGTLETTLDALQRWQQDHETLPGNIDRQLLLRYLHASHGDLGRAQRLLESSFALRNANAHIFIERDPCSPGAQQVLRMADMLAMPVPTATQMNVMLIRMQDSNPELLDFNETIRMFFMVSDVRLVSADPNCGEIPVFDMQGVSLGHFAKLVLSTVRLYMRYTQEAHPALVRQVHVINCSPLLGRVLAIIRPLIRSEVFKTIHFHLPGAETLEAFVPRRLLPLEYGGEAGPLEEMRRETRDRLREYRDYLMDRTRWVMKKPKKAAPARHTEQLAGNFRTLCID